MGYNAGNRHNEYSPTTGFFIVSRPGSVDVRVWDAQAELLQPHPDPQQVRPAGRALPSSNADAGSSRPQRRR